MVRGLPRPAEWRALWRGHVTTVVLVGNAITQQRVGETLYGVETHTGMLAIHADKHAHTEQQCAQSQTHMNTNTHRGWADCCEDGKMDVESHAEKLTRNAFRRGRRPCLRWLLTNACSSHVAGQAQKAASVIFNVQPC